MKTINNKQKIINLTMALVLCIGLFATSTLGVYADTTDSNIPVSYTVESATFSINLPTCIDFSVDSAGNSEEQVFDITNDSSYPIKISSISMSDTTDLTYSSFLGASYNNYSTELSGKFMLSIDGDTWEATSGFSFNGSAIGTVIDVNETELQYYEIFITPTLFTEIDKNLTKCIYVFEWS